eukprot:gnl/MRDRNA2_/MRDRNA2_86009_c1_seq12.p1 gnl/MRDRNA2_/MRDRNA2_86009_c1~~gnl/MRDRNA2_/MRDRNA2_86009_c1_seq12.p1  ORF type:complete len:472 (+),score=51.54 gnl/MRDRNA2_/MRDRNA2_86009_c1_seq12:74-1417(+)
MGDLERPEATANQTVARTVWVLIALFSLWTTGIIFGWPSYVLILNDDGIYTEFCLGGTLDCEERQLRISLMFTFGYCSLKASRLGWGLLLDYAGPRFTAVSSALTIVVGALLLSASFANLFDGFIPAFALVGLGGSGIHLASFHISNLFPAKKKTVITSFSSAFNSSGLIPLVLRAAYVAGLSSVEVFMMYAGLIFCFAIGYFLIHPTTNFQIGDGVNIRGARIIKVPVVNSEAQVGSASNMRIRDAVLHWKMVGLTVFFCTIFLHTQFYQGQAEQVLNRLGDREYGNIYFLAFNAIGAAGALFFYPVGRFLDYAHFHTVFFVSLFLAIILSAVSLVDSLPLQLVTFICWTFSRMMLMAAFFSFIPAVVGFPRFGVTSGVMSIFAALVGLLNIPLAKVARDHDAYKPVMIGFMAVLLLISIFPLLLRQDHRVNSTKATDAQSDGTKQ